MENLTTKTMYELATLCWPAQRLAEGIEALASKVHYPVSHSAEGDASVLAAMPEQVDEADWLSLITGRLGLEVEAVQAAYPDLPSLLRAAAPAVLSLADPDDTEKRVYLLLLGSRFGKLRLLSPELRSRKVPIQDIVRTLTASLAHSAGQDFNVVLQAAQIPPERQQKALQVLLRERLSKVHIGDCWLLRMPPASSFWQQLKHSGARRRLLTLFGGHALYQGLQILAWWVILMAVFNHGLDSVSIWAWALVLLTAVPLGLSVLWAQSQLTIDSGALLKQRLLAGALQLRFEEIRHQGLGQFLGRVLEAETLESLVLAGGFNAAIAFIELATAAVLLGIGAGGLIHLALLLLWVLVTVAISWQFYQRSQRWRIGHRIMINALIERMVGHRTRLAQELPTDWHDDEDQLQARYIASSKESDSSAVQMAGLLTRGWMVLGLAGLAYPLLSEQHDLNLIALSLGGVMLATQAWTHLATGLESLIGVFNAWRQVKPLFHAAPRVQQEPLGIAATLNTDSDNSPAARPVLVAKDLMFGYRSSSQPILNGCNLTIQEDDRILLQGSSGGGKSTLAALLAGLRLPNSGLLLLRGLDRQTLGAKAWRQKVVSAPQFHENHVLTETLAFNLLMGRRWPPTPEDLQAAEELCEELGLGDLIRRMPAGLQQMVGESGWQLSHGERSRLFIARALLQKADLIILDESFAALDPSNLERALRCVLARAPALLVIAHP